jgi:hypothetical protein
MFRRRKEAKMAANVGTDTSDSQNRGGVLEIYSDQPQDVPNVERDKIERFAEKLMEYSNLPFLEAIPDSLDTFQGVIDRPLTENEIDRLLLR